jgi:hypothetical protein
MIARFTPRVQMALPARKPTPFFEAQLMHPPCFAGFGLLVALENISTSFGYCFMIV